MLSVLVVYCLSPPGGELVGSCTNGNKKSMIIALQGQEAKYYGHILEVISTEIVKTMVSLYVYFVNI